MNSPFVNFNGNIVLSGTPILTWSNSIFESGLCFNVNWFAAGSKIVLYEQNLEYLKFSLAQLQMETPEKLDFFSKKLHVEIEKVLTKNKHFQGAKVNLVFFSEQNTRKTSFVISSEKTDQAVFALNSFGFSADVFHGFRCQLRGGNLRNRISPLHYLAINQFISEHNLHECFIVNTLGNVIETINYSLIAIKDKKAFFITEKGKEFKSALEAETFEILKSLSLEVETIDSCLIDQLKTADELLLVNSFQIAWILAFRERRYYSMIAKKVIQTLNTKFLQ